MMSIVRAAFLLIGLLVCAIPRAAAQPIVPAPLPPLEPWHGASEELVAGAADPWITPGEESGLVRSPDYAETIAWLRRLSEAAPEIGLVAIGSSAEGRLIQMAVVSAEGTTDPEALRDNGRPTLLVQAGIHSGEIDGKDAGLMLLRDLTVGGSLRGLLEHTNLLFIPILSVDGHERASRTSRINQRGPEVSGWRTNARNLNLNRDYTKLDTEEIRAVVGVIRRYPVDLYYDIHVTDGADYQYDITFGWTGPHGHSPSSAAWLDKVLRPAVSADLERAGHVPGPLIFLADPRQPAKGIYAWTAPPRFSHGYGDLIHLPTVLVENHSLKPFRRRVLGTRVLLESTLRLLAARGEELRQAAAEDASRRPGRVPLSYKAAESEPPEMDFLGIEGRVELSPVSGAPVIRWLGRPSRQRIPVLANSVPDKIVERPDAYWVPAAWREVISRLAAHGIKIERSDSPVEFEAEVIRFGDPEFADTPYEGRVRVTAATSRGRERVHLPAGSVRIPTDQPRGELVMALLEPDAPDSLFEWGFFHSVLQRTEYAESYALEPLARRMLERDPELRRRFYDRLVSDAGFRGDPRKRLEWFYEKTPYYDQKYRVYPVVAEFSRSADGLPSP